MNCASGLVACIIAVAMTAHVSLAGMVQLGGKAEAEPAAPVVVSSDVGNDNLVAGHADAQVKDNLPNLSLISDNSHSAWQMLLDETSGNSQRPAAPTFAQTSARAEDLNRDDNFPTAGAVIPLPPAVWTGLCTLAGAGWLAMRSRNGRRL